jgi:hypothetical protein
MENDNDSETIEYLDDISLEELYTNMYNIMTLLSIVNLTQDEFLEDIYDEVQTESLQDSVLKRDENIQYNGDEEKYNENEEFECVICKENIMNEEKVIHLHECNHTFHSKCLNEWIKWKSVCPLCYSEIPKKTKKMD